MAAKVASKRSVTELKEKLRSMKLSTSGTKNELTNRILATDPKAEEWLASPASRTSAEMESVDHSAGEQGFRDNASVSEDSVPESIRKELETLRREKEVLERELSSTARDNGEFSNLNGRAFHSNVPINNIAGLLGEFAGVDDSFCTWEKQIELLQRTYALDENATKILMSSKLKGRAQRWFHSRPEYLEMSVFELFEEMRSMFDHRPNRLALRREFERRIWQNNEPFTDYYYDKNILANRISVDEGELIDYIIDGIPDYQLQSQARMNRFSSKSELLYAFRKISLRPRTRERLGRDDGDQRGPKNIEAVNNPRSRRAEEPSTLRDESVRCYNCGDRGHLSSRCQQPRRPRNACFGCGADDHRVQDCPRKRQQTGNIATLTQPTFSIAPYVLPLKYSVGGEADNVCTYNLSAMVDSGSPVSLIKSSYVPEQARSLARSDESLCGINGSKLVILGTFEKNVYVDSIEINMSFLVVPDHTMSNAALLGRDFITCPSVKICLGKTVVVTRVDDTPPSEGEDKGASEIMNINITNEVERASDCLDIDPLLDIHNSRRLKDLYDEVLEMRVDPISVDFEMNIRLKHDQPISSRPRRLAFADQQNLREILESLIRDGVIRPSESEYGCPIVLVYKKDGTRRLCVDFRDVNKITAKDNFPTPLIEDHLDRLGNKQYFSKLDLKNGFHHVKMAESSIKYTAFVTPLGQFEYLRMPFGLTNAPRVFQRFTHKIFRPLIEQNKVLLYLDDILVATEGTDEHLQILREIFILTRQYELNLRLDKCSFLYKEISYLGYSISCDGIRPSGEHAAAIMDYATPRTVRQMHQFVGLASYFRRFVPNFSRVAKPLYDVIKTNKFKFETEECEAFDLLRKCLATQPVLAVYSPNAETELHCDASASGFGAILLQKQTGKALRPVSYFSQRTTSSESKFHSFELECLAVVYSLKRFHIYLSGRPFKILTDCDSFRLTLSKQNVNPRIARWAMYLQQYDFQIEHRSGSRMKHVDALSRCHSILVLESNTFEQILSIKQDLDPDIRRIREGLEKAEDKYFELRNGLVYRKCGKNRLLFYVPSAMESNVIRTCHDDVGHVGRDKVLERVTRTYWFPKIREKIKDYISNCLKCIEFSPVSGKPEGYLHSIPKGNVPFDTIHVDHYGPLEKSRKGNKYVLSVVDGFTKHIRLFVCKSTKTCESIKHLRNYFDSYSRPKRLVTDRGTTFTSQAFKDFVDQESVMHILIAAGTPRANGQVERYNRVLTPMLAKTSTSPDKWDDVLSAIEFSLNNTVCRSTGETPSKLLFGVNQEGKDNDRIRTELESRTSDDRNLNLLRSRATEKIEQSQRINERYYNSRHKDATRYEVGDYVMIRNVDVTAGVNKKLIAKYKGPYAIKTVLERDRYVVADIDGHQLTQRPFEGVVGPDRMKRWARDI